MNKTHDRSYCYLLLPQSPHIACTQHAHGMHAHCTCMQALPLLEEHTSHLEPPPSPAQLNLDWCTTYMAVVRVEGELP